MLRWKYVGQALKIHRWRQRTGSSPVTGTKKGRHDRVVSSFFGLRPGGAGLSAIKIITVEMNSAYNNSPLRSELTRHSTRPPEGGF